MQARDNSTSNQDAFALHLIQAAFVLLVKLDLGEVDLRKPRLCNIADRLRKTGRISREQFRQLHDVNRSPPVSRKHFKRFLAIYMQVRSGDIFESEGMGTCVYCKQSFNRSKMTRDHVIPKSRGGKVTVLCCRPCNESKGDRTPEEWRADIGTYDQM